MEEAVSREGVDVIESTPYVEKTLPNQHANIEWMIGLATKYTLHLDFHLDYNLMQKPNLRYIMSFKTYKEQIENAKKLSPSDTVHA